MSKTVFLEFWRSNNYCYLALFYILWPFSDSNALCLKVLSFELYSQFFRKSVLWFEAVVTCELLQKNFIVYKSVNHRLWLCWGYIIFLTRLIVKICQKSNTVIQLAMTMTRPYGNFSTIQLNGRLNSSIHLHEVKYRDVYMLTLFSRETGETKKELIWRNIFFVKIVSVNDQGRNHTYESQCGNWGDQVPHTYDKKFVKVTFLLKS